MDSAPDKAFVELDTIDRSLLTNKELQARHALLYSVALDKLGTGVASDSIVSIAVSYYSKVNDESNLSLAQECCKRNNNRMNNIDASDTLTLHKAEVIEQRYSDFITTEKKKKGISVMIFICVSLAIGFALKTFNLAKRIHEYANEHFGKAVNQWLSVFDSIIASCLSSDPRLHRESERRLNELIDNRDAFLLSTEEVFSERYPGFTGSLKEKGLNDWEVGLSCLFTLGLNGKEAGEYIQKKRHYIICHEIRKKLGLRENDTNLSIWMKNHLAEFQD